MITEVIICVYHIIIIMNINVNNGRRSYVNLDVYASHMFVLADSQTAGKYRW